MRVLQKKLKHPNLLQGDNKKETETRTLQLRVGLSCGAPEYKPIFQSKINFFVCEIFNLHHLKV